MIGPGTIGVVSGELARFSDFNACLVALRPPEGSITRWARSCNVVANLNAVTEHLHGDWLFVMGDDHAFPPDIIQRLLVHDVPIVAPLCLGRQAPFLPVAFTAQGDGTYEHRDLTGGKRGLVEVDACGNAGMLIHRDVIVKMAEPWWEQGQIDSAKMTEDLWFCQKAKALGFPIYVDTSTALGHIGVATWWPKWDGDTLGLRLTTSGRDILEFGSYTVEGFGV